MSGASKLGLGTVQWGMSYGISNRFGRTTSEEVGAILSEALTNGIEVIDTASLYGEAEAELGTNSLAGFRVISKTPQFASNVITDEQASQLRRVFDQSLQRLSCKKIYGLLIHHADDLLAPGGNKLIDAMEKLKTHGMVEKIGVSVYDRSQIDAIFKLFRPDIVQLPLSVIDQRLLLSGHLKELKKQGVEIHVRSVFLQGLLLMPLNQVHSYFDPIRGLLSQWHAAAKNQQMTLIQAALSFVRDLSYVDTIVVGVESLAQFRSCVLDFSVGRNFDASGLACNDPEFLNPALWKGL